ncbi:MAG: glycosyltransferase family 1 protein, partial [Muribaculaceae bacterium]|nr:glycosyltransferase family 1 protein [Muribaculaceae bacterium]
GEHENRPIINAPIDLEALTQVLEGVVNHPESLRQLGRRSREFVVKHNDSRVVARRFLDFWNERRAAKS